MNSLRTGTVIALCIVSVWSVHSVAQPRDDRMEHTGSAALMNVHMKLDRVLKQQEAILQRFDQLDEDLKSIKMRIYRR